MGDRRNGVLTAEELIEADQRYTKSFTKEWKLVKDTAQHLQLLEFDPFLDETNPQIGGRS